MKEIYKGWRMFVEGETKKDTDTSIVVKAVLYNKDNKFLALKNDDFDTFDLPGGHVKENEELVDGLKREVEEETGLKISNVKKLNYIYDNRMHFYKAMLPAENIKLSDEHSEYELADMNSKSKIHNKFKPAVEEVLKNVSQ